MYPASYRLLSLLPDSVRYLTPRAMAFIIHNWAASALIPEEPHGTPPGMNHYSHLFESVSGLSNEAVAFLSQWRKGVEKKD